MTVTERINALRAELMAGFAAVDARFDAVITRLRYVERAVLRPDGALGSD